MRKAFFPIERAQNAAAVAVAHEDAFEQQRTDHDVGVDAEHPGEGGAVEHPRPVAPGGGGEGRTAEVEAEREAGPFGERGGDGHALDAPAEAKDEEEIEPDVERVHGELDGEELSHTIASSNTLQLAVQSFRRILHKKST